MEIILKQDIKGLGYANDVVTVKPGYGRNYLIPNGFALIANQANKKMQQENAKQVAHKAEKLKQDAEDILKQTEGMNLEIPAKVGENGKIFGAVTTLQISDALKSKGVDVDRKKISLIGTVKEVGEYEAELDLHKEVQTRVKFNVVSE